jgi:hypothetical protein
MNLHRRTLLAGTAAALCFCSAKAVTIRGELPWAPNAGRPPTPAKPGPWQFFTPEEGSAIEALMDRLIPPDPQWAGAKDAGCAVFLDRQLAGPYGSSEGLVLRAAAEEHDRGLLRRPALRRQPGHGELAHDRLPRRALRLSRLGAAP